MPAIAHEVSSVNFKSINVTLKYIRPNNKSTAKSDTMPEICTLSSGLCCE